MKSLVQRLFAIGILLALSTSALGQANTGSVNGTVKDTQGAAVPGAKVTIKNVATNIETTATTSDEGTFIFPIVPVGIYSVSAEAKGFKRVVVEGVKVDVAVPSTVNFSLEVGELTDEVTVTGQGGEVINTSTQELTNVVDRRRILDLPLNGRNPITLATLTAGAATSGGERATRINGLRQSVLNITQDGINVQDNHLRSGDGFFIISSPTVENVEEFTITTSTADASATGSGAVFIRMVTPSGGNEIHGSLFEFHRNTIFDANSFFNNLSGVPRAKLIRNQFGGRIGFPIRKDKTFFWTSFDGTTLATGVTRNRTVLTADARQGIFRYRDTNGAIQTVNLFQAGGIGPDPFTNKIISDRYPLPNNSIIGDDLVTAGFPLQCRLL